MSTQILSLIDGVLSRDLESLGHRKRTLEIRYEAKVQVARRLVNGEIEINSQAFFSNQATARAFLTQCCMKDDDQPNILTAPIPDYHQWALLNAEVLRLKLTRQKLVDRIRSDYALGRLEETN